MGLLLLLVSLAGIWFLVLRAKEIQEVTIRTDLLRTARAAAGLVDGDRHESLAAGGAHLDTNHTALLEPLVRFHRGVPEIAYLYTLVERDGGLVFILDTAQVADRLGFDREMTASALREPYSSESPEEDAAEIAALREGRDYVSETPFQDDFGTFISAVTPVRNASGEVVAILGADLRINDFLERSAGLDAAAWMAASGLSLASLLIGALVYRFRKRLARGEREAVLALRERARLIERDRRLVSALGQILFHFDADKDRFEWRGECSELLGFSLAEMPANRSELSKLIHPRDSAVAFRWEEFTGPDPIIQEFRCRRRDGTDVWTSCRAVVERDLTGRLAGVDGVLLDISQRKAFEAELIAAKNAAEAGARAKSDFLAVMSHEIRTPMNGVVGCTNLLLETPLDSQQREFLETIRKCGDSLLHLINDILDFSKMESDKLTLESRPFSLRDCVGEVLELYGLMAAEKSLELIGLFDDVGLDWVEGDEVRLRQIVGNLVGNAIKFTSHGDVVVTVGRRPWPGDRQAIGISVRDTGIGIPEEKQKTIFQPFSQADTSTTRRFGGTGLGLAICGRLATLMGGAITVFSHPGRGSEFLVLLPLEEVTPPTPVSLPGNLDGCRALLISSHEILGSELLAELKESGLAAAWVVAAPEHVDPPLPDFVIWDTRVPGSETFLERLRQAARPGTVRTIGLVAPTIEGPTLGLGFDQIVTKPLRPGQLARTLAAMLTGSETKAAASAPATGPELAARWPLRILVAEDNATNRKVISHLLQRMGYEPTVVSNGRECVSAAVSGAFDMVLMDVQMPEMDGYEATNRLRNGGSRIWITALTADAMPEDPLRCRIAGMNDYLSKPVRPDALRAAIERCAEALAPRQ
ncbi:MAG: ATP-binding protein [Terrimicrobiaceae bacterium]|nr:ATP-binding protein [Terrimicrobiaceae bacterium]